MHNVATNCVARVHRQPSVEHWPAWRRSSGLMTRIGGSVARMGGDRES
jgi:hypothetical protein